MQTYARNNLNQSGAEAFRLLLSEANIPLSNVWISDDQTEMIYAVKCHRIAPDIERTANRIISSLKLPLEAAIQTFSANGRTTAIDLEVKYKKSSNENFI